MRFAASCAAPSEFDSTSKDTCLSFVIPAQTGIQCVDADEAERPLVIPAQAGFQCLDVGGARESLDSRFRGNDVGETVVSTEYQSAQRRTTPTGGSSSPRRRGSSASMLMARERRWIPAFAGMTVAGQTCRLSTNRRSDETNQQEARHPRAGGDPVSRR
jgi:hypothetical protein